MKMFEFFITFLEWECETHHHNTHREEKKNVKLCPTVKYAFIQQTYQQNVKHFFCALVLNHSWPCGRKSHKILNLISISKYKRSKIQGDLRFSGDKKMTDHGRKWMGFDEIEWVKIKNRQTKTHHPNDEKMN